MQATAESRRRLSRINMQLLMLLCWREDTHQTITLTQPERRTTLALWDGHGLPRPAAALQLSEAGVRQNQYQSRKGFVCRARQCLVAGPLANSVPAPAQQHPSARPSNPSRDSVIAVVEVRVGRLMSNLRDTTSRSLRSVASHLRGQTHDKATSNRQIGRLLNEPVHNYHELLS